MAGDLFGSTLVALLNKYWLRLRGRSRDSRAQAQPRVSPDERISTFVFKRDHVVAKTGAIHYSRLRPRRRPGSVRGRLELSVCRSSALTDEQIWEICAKHFDQHAPRAATGRCDAHAKIVYDVGLTFDPDGIPYPEHTNVIGWQDNVTEPDEKLKHHWMDQQQKMAPYFRFKPRPSTNRPSK